MPSNAVRLSVLSVIVFMRLTILSAEVAAQSTNSGPAGFHQDTWTQFDGRSLRDVAAITQDEAGYLWLGTAAGLLRFDGVRFVRWESIGQRLPESVVSALNTARDGSIWVGYRNSGGVSQIKNGQVRLYNWRDGMLQGPVSSVFEDSQGTLWVAGTFGVVRFKDEHWERLRSSHGIADGTRGIELFEDSRGTFWVTTDSGVLRYISQGDVFERLSDISHRVTSIVEDSAGGIWIPEPKGVIRLVAESRAPMSGLARTVPAAASLLLRDHGGSLWIAGPQRLSLIPSAEWGSAQPLPVWQVRQEAPPAENIRALYEDREGNIWVGTRGGLTRFSATSRSEVFSYPPFVDRQVRAVTADRNNSVWVGTADGLVRFADGKSQSFGERDGLPSAFITALHVDAEGTVWVGTNRGITRFVNGRFLILPGTERLTRVVAMTADLTGRLWLCDFTGLHVWKEGAGVQPIHEPMHRPGASSAFTDTKGRVWIGFVTGGLTVVDGSTITGYTTADGLPDAIVSAIHEDRQGVIWITTTNGVARFKDGRFSTVVDALPSAAIETIAEDDDGHLWLSSHMGLIRVASTELDRAASDPKYGLQFRLLDAHDGFEAANWSGAPLWARGAGGSLWFASRNGITIAHPDRLAAFPPPPAARIERVLVDEQPLSPTPNTSLSPSTRRLQVDFTSLSFAAVSKIQFRYMLDGFDRDWVDAGTERRAFYTNLSPGPYRFRVAPRNIGGMWAEATNWEFVVRAPFYKTKPFYFAFALMVTGAIWGAWHYRISRVRAKYAVVLAERARVGREIHDTLLQGMVGVALQLGVISEVFHDGPPSIRQSIERARDSLERYIRETRSTIWELRSTMIESRGLPAALRQMGEALVAGTDVYFDLVVQGEAVQKASAVEQHLVRIAHEAISNSLRHARARLIRVDLGYEADRLVLRISDDGGGFTPTEGTEMQGTDKWGLKIMRERADEIKAQFRITSTASGMQVETVVV